MSKNDIELYIDESWAYFRFLIESRQWTGFGEKELKQWIKNFDLIDDGKYIACKLLHEAIGYSGDDVFHMMLCAISDILHREVVLKKQLESGFSGLRSDLEYLLREALQKTLFLPLSVNNKPGESGEMILRILTQKSSFPLSLQYSFEIDDSISCDRIIIIDDCIGSGDQFSKFWEEGKIKNNTLLREWCHETGCRAYYVAVVGVYDTVMKLSDKYNDICICCVEMLRDKHRVYNILGQDKDLEKHLIAYRDYLRTIGICDVGYRKLDYMLFLDTNIPNWSLPIMYKERENWEPLLRRKDTSV